MKRSCLIIVSILLAIGTARFCHHQTRGFRLTKIQYNLSEELTWGLEPPDEHLTKILSQPFHYYNRGLQSFVFLSEDEQYVLKIFNNRYQRRIAVYDLLSSLPLIAPWARAHAQLQRAKLNRTFTSYQIAATELKTQTALLYAHLEPTSSLPPSLLLIDPLKIAHRIDPNKLGFVVQHKANMAYPELQKLIESGNLDCAQQRIASLIDLLLLRCSKGIADNDPLIRTNFGFLGEAAVEVDVGPFSKDPSYSLPEVYQPEIHRITKSLKHWLNEHGPELIPFLDQQLMERVSFMNEMDQIHT